MARKKSVLEFLAKEYFDAFVGLVIYVDLERKEA
jgi:hypothetical protein